MSETASLVPPGTACARVLAIPLLCDLILQHLPPKDLARVLPLSTTVFELGVRHLYRDYVYKKHADDPTQAVHHYRDLVALCQSSQKRLEYYTNAVQTVIIVGDDSAGFDTKAEVIQEWFSLFTTFPKAQTARCGACRISRRQTDEGSKYVLERGVKRWSSWLTWCMNNWPGDLGLLPVHTTVVDNVYMVLCEPSDWPTEDHLRATKRKIEGCQSENMDLTMVVSTLSIQSENPSQDTYRRLQELSRRMFTIKPVMLKIGSVDPDSYSIIDLYASSIEQLRMGNPWSSDPCVIQQVIVNTPWTALRRLTSLWIWIARPEPTGDLQHAKFSRQALNHLYGIDELPILDDLVLVFVYRQDSAGLSEQETAWEVSYVVEIARALYPILPILTEANKSRFYLDCVDPSENWSELDSNLSDSLTLVFQKELSKIREEQVVGSRDRRVQDR